ncbi:MAG: hypothetical protein HEP71_21570 [Roseivirga sp.]|nr:hypothetical protein [Roseivirga sp.]
MKLLKQIPITYQGELHEVKLINFSVNMEEVIPLVPAGIKVRDFDGKAIISMVNVKLKSMRPTGLPKGLSFDYQHVAFRLLVEDSTLNEGENKGIFFLKSFSDKPMVVWSGNLMTNYRLSHAQISKVGGFRLDQDEHYIRYQLTDKVNPEDKELKSIIGAIDRAYAMEEGKLMKTLIQRETWPIEQVDCINFETNFFTSAKLLGAFEVGEVIHYHWLAPALVGNHL